MRKRKRKGAWGLGRIRHLACVMYNGGVSCVPAGSLEMLPDAHLISLSTSKLPLPLPPPTSGADGCPLPALGRWPLSLGLSGERPN
jgi:hypothetical protein